MARANLKFALSMLLASGPAFGQGNAVIIVSQDAGRLGRSTSIATGDAIPAASSTGKAFPSLDRNPAGTIDDSESQAGHWP